jgi:hypothetical protein
MSHLAFEALPSKCEVLQDQLMKTRVLVICLFDSSKVNDSKMLVLPYRAKWFIGDYCQQ